MHKSSFSNYIFTTNKDGSGKAASYIKALDWLVEMIKCVDNGFSDCRGMAYEELKCLCSLDDSAEFIEEGVDYG
ncbi:hypothetical protein [Teredinibacter waterburyi]|uniref:hypothetical protein n=1 Tax=Teredinibacter waterburyi TaxID=1500538 RepID=UPI00165F8816|nr:hypothetical protein [Teredinibacter waterburyi]